jgi:hypothetical protein
MNALDLEVVSMEPEAMVVLARASQTMCTESHGSIEGMHIEGVGMVVIGARAGAGADLEGGMERQEIKWKVSRRAVARDNRWNERAMILTCP